MNRRINLDRYSSVAGRLRKRYENLDGSIAVTRNGEPTRYRILESMACVKYLGCDPTKLGVPGLEKVKINRRNVR